MIAIRCRNGGSSAPAGAQTIILPEDANAAMTVAGVGQCNGDEVATGIAGSAGDAMTSIGLICTSVADLGKLSDAAASAAPASALPQVNVAALSSATPAAAGGAMPEPTLVPLSPGSGQPSPMSPAALPAPAIAGPAAWSSLPMFQLTKTANVSKAASDNAVVIDTIASGTSVHYADKFQAWCHIYYGDDARGWTEGWVSTGAVSCAASASLATVKKKTTKSKYYPVPTTTTHPPIVGVPGGGIEIHIGP